MRIVFNPSGTHIHKEKLKVRLDFYPEEGALYDKHYVDEFVDNKPTGKKKLNPCMCALFTVDEMVTSRDLLDILEQRFNANDMATLSNYLLTDSRHYISPFTKERLVLTSNKIKTRDIQDLIASVNDRIKINTAASLGLAREILPESISIGQAASGTTGAYVANGININKNVPADGTGTINTCYCYVTVNDSPDGSFGTNIDEGSNTLSTRDYEGVGTIPYGSEQTYAGLSIDVTTGDYIGLSSTGYFAPVRAVSGVGYWYKTNTQHPISSVALSYVSPRDVWIYGTGTESAGGWTSNPRIIIM